jgi:hypothetical protein
MIKWWRRRPAEASLVFANQPCTSHANGSGITDREIIADNLKERPIWQTLKVRDVGD